MPQRHSIIHHDSTSPFLMIRQDFLTICDGSHCAAALLRVFEYLTTAATAEWTEAQVQKHQMPLVPRSYAELVDDLLDLYARDAVMQAVKQLEELGFLSVWYEQGCETQYRLEVYAIDHAIGYQKPIGKPTGGNRGTDGHQSGNRSDPIGKSTGHNIEEEVEVEEHTQQSVTQPLTEGISTRQIMRAGDQGYTTSAHAHVPPTQPLPTDAYDPDGLKHWLRETYPKHRQRPAWVEKLCEVVTTPEIEAKVRDGLAACLKSEEWGRNVVPSLYKFLGELRFEHPPPPKGNSNPALDAALLAGIEQRERERVY